LAPNHKLQENQGLPETDTPTLRNPRTDQASVDHQLVAIVEAWQNLPANFRTELAAIIDAWVSLPDALRAGIVATVKSAKGSDQG
jgi:hypothetical protein